MSFTKKIFQGAAISFMTRVGGVGLMFIAQALMARSMSQAEYGYFIYGISIIPVLAFFGKLGYEATPIRFLHEYEDQPKLRNGFILSTFGSVAVLSAIASGLIFAISLIFRDSLPDTVQHAFQYGSWIILFLSLTYVAQGILKAVKLIFYSQFFAQLFLPLILLIATFASGMQMTSTGGYLAYGGAFLISTLWAWFIIYKRVFKRQSTYEMKNAFWLRISMPLFVSLLVTALIPRLGNIVIGFIEGPEEVAAYSVVSRIAVLFTFITSSMTAIADPTISELYQKRDYARILSLTRKVYLISILIGLAGLVFIALAGQYLLLAFGENYVAYKGILLILIIGQAVNIMNGPSISLFTITNHQDTFMKIMLGSCVSLSILLAIGIHFSGLVGAAVATSVNMLFTSIAIIYIFNKITGLRIL
jgi:O-antigen/teichoic acid export membrane protein